MKKNNPWPLFFILVGFGLFCAYLALIQHNQNSAHGLPKAEVDAAQELAKKLLKLKDGDYVQHENEWHLVTGTQGSSTLKIYHHQRGENRIATQPIW